MSNNLRVGAIVVGEVFRVEDTLAYISVGGKQEGRIYLEYYTSNKEIKSLKEVLKEGDRIRVEVSKVIDGLPMLSRLNIEEKERKDKVIKKIMNHKPFMAQCVGKNKDNEYVLNKDGVQLILPENYVDLKADFDKDSIINTEVKVVFAKSDIDEKGKTRLVVSRKQVQYNEERRAKEEEFNSINVDDVLTGTVARITNFGAFIKFNQIEGLCHLSEISHYRIKSPEEMLTVGQEVTVKVIKKTDTKLHLSIKVLEKTPWEIFGETHKVNDTIACKIVRKTENYMICSPERDINGILNQNDYSWKKDSDFAGTVNEGDELELQITYLDIKNGKMTLSKKSLEYNPWHDAHIKQHDIVTGTVVRFTNNGAVLKVGEVEGTISNKDCTEDGQKPASEVFKIGDVVNAEVITVNPLKWLLILSVRTIKERETQAYVEKYEKENVSGSYSLADALKELED